MRQRRITRRYRGRGRLIALETHQKVFSWVLQLVAKEGLLKGNTIGIDATTLEANAALRSIVRRDSGEKYEEFLKQLAKEAGIETPTREQLAQMDRKRTKRMTNEEWKNPHDPDAKITKMKRRLDAPGHKAEHAVDMETGAVVAVDAAGSQSRGHDQLCGNAGASGGADRRPRPRR